MRKLLTLILVITMSLCLVNLNNNYTKAEDEQGEQVQYVQAQPVEQLKEAATNEVVQIHNEDELISYLEGNSTLEAKLVNDITYDKDNSESNGVYDIKLQGKKVLDLNGKDITFDTCLSLYSGTDGCSLTIYNSNALPNSTLKVSKDFSHNAIIATRLYKHNSMVNMTLNIGRSDTENQDDGDIVFDGNNEDIVGVGVGYFSMLHEKGYYDNNNQVVNISKTEFKNFGSSKEELSEDNAGAAIANVGGTVYLSGTNCIHDNCAGVVMGKYNDGYSKLLKTDLYGNSVTITENYYGVINGLYLGENPSVEPSYQLEGIEPGAMQISGGAKVSENIIGASYYRVKPSVDPPSNDDPYFKINTSANVIGNTYIDYYCAGKDAVYDIAEIPAGVNDVTSFAVEPSYWEGTIGLTEIPVAIVGNTLSDSSNLFSMNNNLVAKFKAGGVGDNKIVLAVFGTDQSDPKPTQKDKGDMAVDKDGVFVDSFTEGNASAATVHLSNIDYDATKTFVKILDTDNGYTTLTEDDDYELSGGSTKITFKQSFLNKLAVGQHNYYIIINDGNKGPNYPFYVSITVANKPAPVPQPTKDESCEKVIGPTWHWNNKKGICEDGGSVKTYSR